MPLPIRRATPQPRPRPVRPQRVAPAPLASPQAKPTLALRGHVWIPRPRISPSRLVQPAPLASPQAKPTLAARGHVWTPRPRITPSRLIVPAPAVATVPPVATLAQQGIARRQIAKAGRPRIVVPALLASPQAPSTNVIGIRRGPTRPLRSRLVIPAPAPVAPVLVSIVLQGIRRRLSVPARSRVVRAAPLASPQAPSTNVAGVRRGPTKPGRPRLTLAPLAAPQAPGIFAGQGVRRRNFYRPGSRSFVGPTIQALSPAKVTGVVSPVYVAVGAASAAYVVTGVASPVYTVAGAVFPAPS